MANLLMVVAALCAGACCFLAVGLAGEAAARPRRSRREPRLADNLLRLAELAGHSAAGALAMRLPGAGEFARRLSGWLGQRGRHVSPQGALASYIATSILVCLVLCLISMSVLGAAVGIVASLAAAGVLSGSQERRRRDLFAAQMPEALRCLSGALGAGKSLSQAIEHAGNTLPEPIGPEFLQASFEIKAGQSVEDAVEGMCGRIDAPGIALLGTALQISQRTGSALNDLFAQTAQMASDSVALRRELEVKTSQVRLSAKVVAAMPVVLCAFLTLLSGDYRAGLALQTGRTCLTVAVLLDVCALLLVRRVMSGSLK